MVHINKLTHLHMYSTCMCTHFSKLCTIVYMHTIVYTCTHPHTHTQTNIYTLIHTDGHTQSKHTSNEKICRHPFPGHARNPQVMCTVESRWKLKGIFCCNLHLHGNHRAIWIDAHIQQVAASWIGAGVFLHSPQWLRSHDLTHINHIQKSLSADHIIVNVRARYKLQLASENGCISTLKIEFALPSTQPFLDGKWSL